MNNNMGQYKKKRQIQKKVKYEKKIHQTTEINR